MNEKLIVKNFGPIKDAELELKKVTVFIGPQGSGKSTLAKLVAICKSSERPLYLDNGNTTYRYIKDYGMQVYITDNSLLSYNAKLVSLGLKNQQVIKVFSDLGNKMNEQFNEIYERAKIIGSLGNASSDSLTPLSQKLLKLLSENNILESIYIPTERFLLSTISSSLFGLMNNDINLPKTLTEFGNRYSKASTNDSEEDARFIRKATYESGSNKTKYIELFDLQFQHRDGQDFLIDTKNNYEINLRDSASGMQSSIPLILVVRHEYNEGNKHFIIEEPELNLFPTTQKQLIGYLADKCTQNGNELLMTTHSPYVLSAINNLIFAYKVAHEVPEKADEVAEIIPREQWLNPDDVAAYYVGEGTVTSIMEDKFGLIGENELDAISEDIAGERDVLFKILRSKKRETVN
jgi:predicted ATPase